MRYRCIKFSIENLVVSGLDCVKILVLDVIHIVAILGKQCLVVAAV